MGFRFYRRVRLFPGVSVNLSRSGPSLSVGVRGAHVTMGSRGVTKTVGIPGTGLFYTSRSGHHTGVHSAHSVQPLSAGRTSQITPPVAGQAGRGCGAAILGLVALLVGVALLLSH